MPTAETGDDMDRARRPPLRFTQPLGGYPRFVDVRLVNLTKYFCPIDNSGVDGLVEEGGSAESVPAPPPEAGLAREIALKTSFNRQRTAVAARRRSDPLPWRPKARNFQT